MPQWPLNETFDPPEQAKQDGVNTTTHTVHKVDVLCHFLVWKTFEKCNILWCIQFGCYSTITSGKCNCKHLASVSPRLHSIVPELNAFSSIRTSQDHYTLRCYHVINLNTTFDFILEVCEGQ